MKQFGSACRYCKLMLYYPCLFRGTCMCAIAAGSRGNCGFFMDVVFSSEGIYSSWRELQIHVTQSRLSAALPINISRCSALLYCDGYGNSYTLALNYGYSSHCTLVFILWNRQLPKGFCTLQMYIPCENALCIYITFLCQGNLNLLVNMAVTLLTWYCKLCLWSLENCMYSTLTSKFALTILLNPLKVLHLWTTYIMLPLLCNNASA